MSCLLAKTTKNSFSESDCILVLGEGNFTFSLYLSNCFKCKIIATEVTGGHNIESDVRRNCEHLMRSGHEVYFGIDATKLETYDNLKSRQDINHIIFNFPHILTKKMKIGLNRDLLKRFFQSAEKFIAGRSDVKVMVSLCSGQSGINAIEAEDKQRKWWDSWQLPEMAAYGNFVITSFNDFCFDYQLFGYRLRNISFNRNNSKTFLFQKRDNIHTNAKHLSQTLLNNDKNLFSNHLIKGLINDLKKILNQSLDFETEIDLTTNSFPFVKHWIVVKRNSESVPKLNHYFNDCLIVSEEQLVSNNVIIGRISSSIVRLSVESLSQLKWKISDSRILWSKYLYFDERDKEFTTGSLFYRQHIHDLSFWVNSDSYYYQLLETILDVFSTLLKSIQMIDKFESNGKTSKCYRITYESVDSALTQQKSNQMQNIVRDLLSERHRFVLR